MMAKALYCIVISLAFVFALGFTNYTNSKFFASLFFGYVCNRFWNGKLPMKELGYVWISMQPIIFGTVGATLVFSELNTSDVGYSLLMIFCG